MIAIRTAAPLLLLVGCGSEEAPKAPPGAVEQVTEALDRNEAAERKQTIRRLDREAEQRAVAAERRIEASEKARLKGD
jgi:hypothetical protein